MKTITHKIFGTGTIIEELEEMLTIQFDCGIKKISKEFFARKEKNVYNLNLKRFDTMASKNVNKLLEYYKIDNSKTWGLLLDELVKLIEIAEKENLVISCSPYSFSFYAHKTNEEITWGYKPQNSYRLSDHWNFESNDEIHCITKDKIKNKITIKKFNNGIYE